MITRGQQSTDSITAGQHPAGGDQTVSEPVHAHDNGYGGTVQTYAGLHVDTLAASTSSYHITTRRRAIVELLAEYN